MAVGEKSPFADSRTESKPATPGRFVAPWALIAFAVCLLIGLVAVVVRANRPPAPALAQSAARALAAQLERQLSQATTAAEILGALAQQSGGAIPNFQRVAGGLLAAHPDLATLEWQPGGLVSDMAPRAGNERILGRLNVLSDPVYRPGAITAYQRHLLTVTGPLPLYHGELGIIARVPVYQRGRDGRETCSFVAVSMPLARAFAATDEAKQLRAFNYAFYAPAQPSRPFTLIAASANLPNEAAVLESVRLQDLELKVAVQPRGSGASWSKIGCEFLGVLFLSSLIAWLINMVENRHAIEESIADATRRLHREAADRKQAEEACRNAQDKALACQAELKQSAQALEQAQAETEHLKAQLQALQSAQRNHEAAQSKLQQTEAALAELQNRLNTTVQAAAQAAQAGQAELEQMRAQLAQTRKTLQELEARLASTTRAEQDAAASGRQRQEKDAAAIADLQSRLDAAIRAAEKGAEKAAANEARLQSANEELNARLSQMDQNSSRISELAQLLEDAQAELQRHQQPAPAEVQAEPAVLLESQAPAPEPAADTATAAEPSAAPALEAESPQDHVLTADQFAAAEFVEPSPSPLNGQAETPPAAEPAPPEPLPIPERDGELDGPATIASVESPKPAAEPAPEPGSPTAAAADPAAPAEPMPAPAPKRRKGRRDDQMDLFGGAAPSASAAGESNGAPKTAEEPAPARRKAPHHAPEPATEADPAQLRKAVNLILPLLSDQDPGAKDCLHDNQAIFRAGFGAEEYARFEAAVQRDDFNGALEHLKKATRK